MSNPPPSSPPLNDKDISAHFVKRKFENLKGHVTAVCRHYSLTDNAPEELYRFTLQGQDDVVFFWVGYAKFSYNTEYRYSEEEFKEALGEASIGVIGVKDLMFVALVKESLLIKPYQPRQLTEQIGLTNEVKPAVVNSFARIFEEKPILSYSFLDYLSRHFGKEKHDINPQLGYYAPLVSVHQSSGAGKSRLMEEISEFVIPLIISGPNPTGLPSGSKLLSEFKDIIVEEANRPPPVNGKLKVYIHIDNMMAATSAFLMKTIYHAVCERIRECGADVDDSNGKLIQFTETVAKAFFSSSIEADLAGKKPLEGLKEYLQRCDASGKVVLDSTTFHPKLFADKLKKLFESVRAAREEYLIRVLEIPKDKVKELKEILEWLPDTLLVFDEAQGLSAKLDPKVNMPIQDLKHIIETDPFRVIRRTTRNDDLFWEHIWSVTISTNSSVSNFAPSFKDDNSLRPHQHIVVIPPFIYHETFDVFAKDYALIWNDKQDVVPEDGLAYVFSWKRVGHILSCGRPLFYSFVEAQMSKDLLEKQVAEPLSIWSREADLAFDLLFQIIVQKLQGGSANLLAVMGCRPDNALMYALLSASVGLYAFPEVLLEKEDMIRRRMSWVVSYNAETKDLEIDYPSEGMFNYICAIWLEKKLNEFLQDSNPAQIMAFFAKPACKKQFDTWQVVEVLSRLCFLLATHRSKPYAQAEATSEEFSLLLQSASDSFDHNRLVDLLHPRSVQEMLEMFAGEGSEGKSEVDRFFDILGPQFEGALTSFGYFSEIRSAMNPLPFVQSMLFRGSARYFADKSHPGADAVLPLVFQDGKYGLLLLQIKGVQKNILANGKPPKKAVPANSSAGDDDGEDHDDDDEAEEDCDAGASKGNANFDTVNGDDEKLRPTAFVRKSMKLCTLDGVFGFSTDNSDSEGGKAKREKIEADNLPVIRVIFNLNSSQDAGIKCLRDNLGPILAIQSDGHFPSLLKRNEADFVNKALQTAEKAWEGKLPRYEAHKCDPAPIIPTSPPPKPYNPSFGGTLHDEDFDIFRGTIREYRPDGYIDESKVKPAGKPKPKATRQICERPILYFKNLKPLKRFVFGQEPEGAEDYLLANTINASKQ